jgi:hypothetical protein
MVFWHQSLRAVIQEPRMNHLPNLSGEGTIFAEMVGCFGCPQAKLADQVVSPPPDGKPIRRKNLAMEDQPGKHGALGLRIGPLDLGRVEFRERVDELAL